jgi:GNAT superfamily N-acetyltransferase
MIRKPDLRAEWAFIRAHWVKGYKGSRFARACGAEHYNDVQTRIARHLAHSCSVLVACDPDSPAVLWGFACWHRSTLHFVAVAPELRGHGIARDLLAGLSFDRTSHEGWRGLPVVPLEAWPQ